MSRILPCQSPVTVLLLAYMTGYTKLFGSIVHSTIWREATPTRIVWITLLALKDGRGDVHASVPGLADAARVTRAECEEALERLCAPDPDSSNREEEGRRIIPIEGGWFVVSHQKYSRMLSVEERRERDAARKRVQRQSATVRDVTDVAESLPSRSILDPDPELDPEPEESLSKAAEPAPDALAVVRRVFDKWRAIHNHPTSKLDAKRTARIRNALKLHTPEQLEQALSGALKDDWIMGRDPKSPRKYDGIETILRDAAQVERLIDLDSGKPNPNANVARLARKPGVHQPNHGKTGWE